MDELKGEWIDGWIKEWMNGYMNTANLGCLPSSQPSFPVHLCIALLLQTVEEHLEHHHPVEETRHIISACQCLKQCSP